MPVYAEGSTTRMRRVQAAAAPQQGAKPHSSRKLSHRQARFVKGPSSDHAHQSASGEARKPAPDLIAPAPPKLIQPSRRQVINTASTALMGACACCAGLAQPANAAAKGNWNYLPTYAEQEGGPQKWGGTCVVGAQQSPVDIQYSSMQGGRLMNLAKAPEHRIIPRLPSTPRCQITNGGHGTMQVNMPEGACKTSIGGRKLTLVQFHFHTPSEHMLDGQRFDMEAHLVHRDIETGGLTVLGVMLKRNRAARSNPCLRKALDMAPEPGEMVSDVTFDPSMLLPPASAGGGSRTYFNYSGSLTTPPCSEAVEWCVFAEPVAISDDDLLDFIQFSGGGVPGANSRPVTPMNGRNWTLYFA